MEKKKSIILTIVAVATLIALVVGATFAYFQAIGGTGANAGVNVTTYTTDLLTFMTGNAISIYADQSNFASGLGNQSGTTFARAHLLANNKTNTATDNYYVYLNISKNTFEYTQEDSTAELLLQVTDPNGVEVTTLSGLEYKTVTDGNGTQVSGFDVTTFEGLITIANNYEIVANPDTTQTWNVTIVFVNLDADQTKNTGKTLSASLTITKEKDKSLLTMADVCADGQTLASCVKSMYGKDNNLYYHDSTLENGANDNSYRYAGSTDTVNNFVCFGSNAAKCPDNSLYRIIGVFGDQVKLIKWDYATTTLLGTNGDSNGACSDDSGGCISTFNKDYYKGSNRAANIGIYWWNNDGTTFGTNTWSASELNTVNLNTNFLNSIKSTWADKIATTKWKVGGNTQDNIYNKTISVAYTNEYTNPAQSTIYNAKIGLVYTSDYGFAASPSAWTTTLYNYKGNDTAGNKITEENWMYMGLWDWTMVRRSDTTNMVFVIYPDGSVSTQYVGNIFINEVRPVFHLESSVNYVSGDGTKTNPIIID